MARVPSVTRSGAEACCRGPSFVLWVVVDREGVHQVRDALPEAGQVDPCVAVVAVVDRLVVVLVRGVRLLVAQEEVVEVVDLLGVDPGLGVAAAGSAGCLPGGMWSR